MDSGLIPTVKKKKNEKISANNISTRAVNIGVGISVDKLFYLGAIMAHLVKVLQEKDLGKVQEGECRCWMVSRRVSTSFAYVGSLFDFFSTV